MTEFLVQVRARHSIWDNPNNEIEPTSRIDQEGRILYAPKIRKIQPGTIFEINDRDEFDRLLEADAIEVLP